MDLNFLTIADLAEDLQPLRGLLRPFESDSSVHISLQRVGWDRAWQTLLMDALEGKGPHVSQIGSSWTATMSMLDALRRFQPNEIESMGGEAQFLPAAWSSVKSEKYSEIWAIPWSIYIFVLYYRRDLLERAGLDPEKAFATPQAMRESFKILSQHGITPWAFPSLHPYADLAHIASSFARANGGDFISADGRKPMFASPESSAGLKEFFELYSFIPTAMHGLSSEACAQAFASGETAVLVGGVEIADELLNSPDSIQEVRDNLGMTTPPGVPWIGGDHLVIWKSVRANAELEQSALDLLRFLSKKETQLEFYKLENILPARIDAYSEIKFSLDSTAATIQRILQTGRPHPTLQLWRRIEAFLNEMLTDIGSAVLRKPETSASEIAERMLAEYEQKLAAMLKG
ncbi:MAG: extracellular solute-binding protein [Anaerolineales bacterium]|uniref:extracellular solute-binding protein n=1 Tax=Candidatus Villigracilis proximus TaxID=3140683 RepID=UPI003135ECF3|nr:extracellular solute-binding protein [Anaerolineales bacterium]